MSNNQICRLLPIFRRKINQALSTLRTLKKGQNDTGSSSIQGNGNYVYKMEIVSKTSMYGYHADPVNFIKIHLYFPDDVNKLAHFLQVVL